MFGRHGGFADRVRAQWTWVRPIPDLIRIQRNRIGAAKICDQCRLVEFPARVPST
jgi:hypothetical protein